MTSGQVQALAPPPLGKDGGRALLAWLRDMREARPVWRDASDSWHVFRQADVRGAAGDPGAFSSDLSGLNPGMARIQRGTLTRMDPPAHHRLRRLVSQSFTPKRVAELAPRIREITDALLDCSAGLPTSRSRGRATSRTTRASSGRARSPSPSAAPDPWGLPHRRAWCLSGGWSTLWGASG